MAVILYARFSPRPDEDVSESVRLQVQALREYCQARNLPIRSEVGDNGAFCDVARSGAEFDRPGLWEAIDSLKRGDVLLVHSYDRVARDVMEVAAVVIGAIERKGCQLWSMTEGAEVVNTPVGRMVRGILLHVAECDRLLKNARTRSRMRGHQANGRAMSSTTPYGYSEGEPKEIRRPDGSIEKQRTLIPNEDEQKWVDQIITWHDEGLSMRRITFRLHEAGANCRGGRWYHQTIRSILVRAGRMEPKDRSKPKKRKGQPEMQGVRA